MVDSNSSAFLSKSFDGEGDPFFPRLAFFPFCELRTAPQDLPGLLTTEPEDLSGDLTAAPEDLLGDLTTAPEDFPGDWKLFSTLFVAGTLAGDRTAGAGTSSS